MLTTLELKYNKINLNAFIRALETQKSQIHMNTHKAWEDTDQNVNYLCLDSVYIGHTIF